MTFLLLTRIDFGYTADVSLLPMKRINTSTVSFLFGNSSHMWVIS